MDSLATARKSIPCKTSITGTGKISYCVVTSCITRTTVSSICAFIHIWKCDSRKKTQHNMVNVYETWQRYQLTKENQLYDSVNSSKDVTMT